MANSQEMTLKQFAEELKISLNAMVQIRTRHAKRLGVTRDYLASVGVEVWIEWMDHWRPGTWWQGTPIVWDEPSAVEAMAMDTKGRTFVNLYDREVISNPLWRRMVNWTGSVEAFRLTRSIGFARTVDIVKWGKWMQSEIDAAKAAGTRTRTSPGVSYFGPVAPAEPPPPKDLQK